MTLNFQVFILNLIATLILYGIFPVAFAGIRRKPLAKKKYRILCTIITVAIWLAIGVVNSFSGSALSSGAPAILWGYLFYKVGANILQKKNLFSDVIHISDNANVDSDEDLSSISTFEKKEVLSPIEKNINSSSETHLLKNRNFLVISLIIVIAILVGLNIWQFQSNRSNIKTIADLEEKLETMTSNYDDAKKESEEIRNHYADMTPETFAREYELNHMPPDDKSVSLTIDGETYTANIDGFKYSGN